MTKEEARHLLPVIKAYSEGKAIQHKVYDMKDGTSEWEDLKKNDEWNWRGEYRIKPEPKYRPFKDAEECWNEMQKHQPFGWVKVKDADEIKYTIYCTVGNLCDFEADFDDYTFADGTPFGIKEEK